MSQERTAPSRERRDETETDYKGDGRGIVNPGHSYNLRPSRRPAHTETLRAEIEAQILAPGVDVEANHRPVGGHNERVQARSPETDDESDARYELRSEVQSELSEQESEGSGYMESRSRVTTPDSSLPSSPRRRAGAEEDTSLRQVVAKDIPVPPGQPHIRDERSDEALGLRRVPSAAREGADPTDLELRSTRLIEQLQKFIQEREQALASPRNDPYISRGRLASREDEAVINGRHGPQSSKFFGTDPARPGTEKSHAAATRFSDSLRKILKLKLGQLGPLSSNDSGG